MMLETHIVVVDWDQAGSTTEIVAALNQLRSVKGIILVKTISGVVEEALPCQRTDEHGCHQRDADR